MPFVKSSKSKAYFKRYQVKYRRRREGKTDYYARKRLVTQDKNKYQSPKYRLVVRLTNHYVICQVVYAEIEGDRVMAAAYSSELPRYGIKVGLKNYAAAYATGLLVARRLLTKLGLAEAYKGNEKVTGSVVKTEDTNDAGRTREYFVAAVNDEKKPFRAYLDVGIRPTTTGARVFGAMKGASDGGLDIPHNEKRFPGYNAESKEYKADVHRQRIMGKHVQEYMVLMQEDDPEAYVKKFAGYIKSGVMPDQLEKLYAKVHAAIRKDPSAAPKKAFKGDKKFAKPSKSTLEGRKQRVAAKKEARIAELRAAAAAGGSDE
jgi:large subunit ribosomal protein L5e